MIIREYNNETDYEGLRQCVISLQDHEKTLNPRMPSGREIIAKYVPDLFRRCRTFHGKILVADLDGTIAGYVLILCKVVSDEIDEGDTEFGLVGDLVVLEEFRKKGYGARLLSAAEEEARVNNVRWLRIGVLSANRAAFDLYLSSGFSPLFLQLEKTLS